MSVTDTRWIQRFDNFQRALLVLRWPSRATRVSWNNRA